jgi:hypothetical protein
LANDPLSDIPRNSVNRNGNEEITRMNQSFLQPGDFCRQKIHGDSSQNHLKYLSSHKSKISDAQQSEPILSLSAHNLSSTQAIDEELNTKQPLSNPLPSNGRTDVYDNRQEHIEGISRHEDEKVCIAQPVNGNCDESMVIDEHLPCSIGESKETTTTTKSDIRDISDVMSIIEAKAAKHCIQDAQPSQASTQSDALLLPWNQGQEDKESAIFDLSKHPTASTPKLESSKATKRSPFEVPDMANFKRRAMEKFKEFPAEALTSRQECESRFLELKESAEKADIDGPNLARCISTIQTQPPGAERNISTTPSDYYLVARPEPSKDSFEAAKMCTAEKAGTDDPELSLCILTKQSQSSVFSEKGVLASSSDNVVANTEPSKETLEAVKIRTTEKVDTDVPELARCVPAQRSQLPVAEWDVSRSSSDYVAAKTNPTKENLKAAKIQIIGNLDTSEPELSLSNPANQSPTSVDVSDVLRRSSDDVAKIEPSEDTLEAAKILSTFNEIPVPTSNRNYSPSSTNAKFSSAGESESGKRKRTTAQNSSFESPTSAINCVQKSFIFKGINGNCTSYPEKIALESHNTINDEPQTNANDFRLLHSDKFLRGMQSTVTWFHVVNLCLSHEVSHPL